MSDPRRLQRYIRVYAQLDVSGAVQSTTSHLLRKRNEVASAKNAAFNQTIGSSTRRDGYEKVGETIESGNDSLGLHVFRYGVNNKVVVGINNTANTFATLRYLDTGGYWTTMLSNAAANTRFQMINDLDKMYVAGMSDGNVYLPLTSVDLSLVPSTTNNVAYAPASRFIAEYAGELYALNCVVNGVTYSDRFYKSSPPLGAITFVQTDQSGLLLQLRVDSTRYLKAGMTVDIYGAGSNNKKVSALAIVSVDKKNERISFNATQIAVLDNDEIWLTGTKGTLSRFWNTDYKTPETADWDRVPSGKFSDPAITGWGKNGNRFLIFTKNGFLKFDGANLITRSETIGCVSHETIQNIGDWTLWLHTTGAWGYNVVTDQLKLLSRSFEKYFKAINQTNLSKASAVVVGQVYKLAVGELLPFDTATTSTSTSSTTVTTTSTSTSSTSTSSTSTSSTTVSTSTSSTSSSTSSTSTSSTSSSTSSTSHSTSSTSTSSTSTSMSTSTSSTTTTTLASTKNVARLIYDFDLNTWWPEFHKREFRFQMMHTMHGYTKPYFTDETGRLFRDETTHLDNADTIPYEKEYGRNNFGMDTPKVYNSVLVDSTKSSGATLMYSIDGEQFKTLGDINDNVQKLMFPQSGQLIEGVDINYKFVHNDGGEAPIINGIFTYYTLTMRHPDESGAQ